MYVCMYVCMYNSLCAPLSQLQLRRHFPNIPTSRLRNILRRDEDRSQLHAEDKKTPGHARRCYPRTVPAVGKCRGSIVLAGVETLPSGAPKQTPGQMKAAVWDVDCGVRLRSIRRRRWSCRAAQPIGF